jgi:hypothetical protein
MCIVICVIRITMSELVRVVGQVDGDAVGGKDGFLLLEIVLEAKEERQTLMVWMGVTSEVEGSLRPNANLQITHTYYQGNNIH